MPGKRNILFLMPSLVGGGAERTLINLLKRIDYDRYEVDLLVIAKHGIYINQIPERVNVSFIFDSYFLVRILAFIQRKTGITWFFKKRIQNRYKKQFDTGISFLDSNFTDLIFHVTGIRKKFAFIHSSYKTNKNFAQFYENETYKQKLKDYRYSMLDGLFFVSQDAMDEFIELFGSYPQMEVIYNMIDAKSVTEKAKAETVENWNEGFRFFAAGSLLPVKGFDRLIRAAGIARDRGYNFCLKIAGSGPDEKQLKSLIRNLQLDDNISLMGFQSNPYPYMKSADVFIMSSVSEALPTVLCEAMILGKPTLVTNCSGCRGLVESGIYGVMAKQDDYDLAEKMMMYMDNPELMGHYSRKSLERAELFDDERVLQVYYEMFDG